MQRSIGILVFLGAVAVTACAKDAGKTDTAMVAQAGAATTAGYDPATRVATIIAKDYAFETPDTVPAGWTTLRLINAGQTLHHASLVRLDSGKTVADLEAALKTPGQPPRWIVAIGGPNAPDPKSESNAMVDLTAGNYALVCFVDVPNKMPHFAKGMVHAFTVTPATAPTVAPTATVTIALTDYAFTVQSGTLSAGKQTVKIVNQGPQEHEIELVRLAPGKTMQDFGAWMQKMDGPPPASAIGGISGLTKGTDSYFNVDLTPGNYAFICFISDSKDGKPHLEHGMVKEFTVN